ncbi:MAG: Omega-amino acid--pyruvate aminotransferase, partial [uncultured Nocardioidaceae bacterium]
VTGNKQAAPGRRGARDGARGLLPDAEVRPRPPVDALHPDVELRPGRRTGHRPGRGRLRVRRAWPALSRRPGRTVREPAGARAHRPGRGGSAAGQGAGVLPALVLRASHRRRARGAGREHGARGPQPGLLHQRRGRGRRDGLEAGQELLQAHRQADEAQGDQPQHRLPRHHPGCALDHRAPEPQGGLRAAGAQHLPGAEHELLPRPTARRRPGGVRSLGSRPDRRGDRGRGPRDRRRRLPRAGAERRRLLPAAAGLLPAGAGDLRRVRRAAGQRRGDLRLRQARPHVRRRALRLPAGHDHLRQGTDLRLRAARRDDRLRPAHGAVLGGHGHVRARLHLRWAPGLGGGGHGEPRRLRERGHKPARAGQTGRLPGDLGEAHRPADRRRHPWGRVLLRHRAGQGQGDQGDLRRRRVREAAEGLLVQGPVRGRPVLPRRRPWRPCRSAVAAADLRPAALRRDRARTALGAGRGDLAPL